MRTGILVKIIAIPTFHFLVSVLLVGTGLTMLLQDKKSSEKSPAVGNFLFAVSLGILYNALQFCLVLLVYPELPFNIRSLLGIGKYTLDLVFILLIILLFRKNFFIQLKRMITAFLAPGNAALLLLSLLLGLVAVINFPHVHDSGQLMVTNGLWLHGNNSFPFKRLALGFSAFCYFPATIAGGVPMASLAAGFKLFLMVLCGLTAIYVMDKLGTAHRALNRYAYFFIIVFSIFGLRGLMEVGKDSIWAILFSVIFIFSLVNRKSGFRPLEAISYLLCTVSLGVIALPILLIFLSIYFMLRALPDRLAYSKMILPAAVILLLVIGFLVMPVKLAINTPPGLESVFGPYSYWYPTDGLIPFFEYFFLFKFNGYANSPLVIMVGLAGIFFLPRIRKGIQDPATQAAALLLPVATSAYLLLVFMGRNFFPASLADKIPLTPFSTFDAWDLIKDIPQWYIQIIAGIFCILLLEALACRIAAWTRSSGIVHYGMAIIIVMAAIFSANFFRIVRLANPAHFFSYGGNKNKHAALVFEILYCLPSVKTILFTDGIKTLNPENFFFDVQSYFTGKKVETDWTVDPDGLSSLASKNPVLLITDTVSFSKLQVVPKKIDGLQIRRMALFKNSSEGVYFVSPQSK